MTPVLAVILGYLAIVLAIGFLGHRLFRGTGEDYFLASRTILKFLGRMNPVLCQNSALLQTQTLSC